MQHLLRKSLCIVALAALIVSAYFITGLLIFANNQYNNINSWNLEQAARTLQHFTPPAVFTDTSARADWALRFGGTGESSYHRITLINRNGQVLFDSEADSLLMENHLNRQEFQAAVRHGMGTSRRRSPTLGQYHLYAAIAIEDSNGSLAGVLRLSRLVPGFFARLLSSTMLFFIGGLLVVLGAFIGVYRFSRRLSLSVEAELDAELKEKTAVLRITAEKAKAESHHHEVILNSIFDGVITLDSQLAIIHANPRICSLFGIEDEKIASGMSFIEFSRSVELEEAARLVLSTGRPYELTFKRFTSGAQQYFQVFAAPMEAGSHSGGLVMVLGDISRLVKLERVRKDFAANVSHELRTPIQVIQGFAENILASSAGDIEQIYHFAGIIQKNARSMDNLTNDLLILVSLEDEDSVRPAMETGFLAPLIDEAADIVAPAAKKKNIDLAISCSEDICIPLYSLLLVQALVNLMDNSIKYSGNDSVIKINAFREDADIVIEVKDKGIGIPAEHIDRIFERFYRVDRARSREEGGTGLGLAIVRHITRPHRGTVSAESHAGEGSVFRIKLPVE